MRALLLLPYYVRWHYSRALISGWNIFCNFIWFVGHFFSIGLLFRTLFQPWERMVEERAPGFTFGNFFSTITLNLVVRFAGAVIRSAFIFTGLLCMAVITLIYIGGLVVWLVFPFAIVACLAIGVGFLYKAL